MQDNIKGEVEDGDRPGGREEGGGDHEAFARAS